MTCNIVTALFRSKRAADPVETDPALKQELAEALEAHDTATRRLHSVIGDLLAKSDELHSHAKART